MRSCWNSPSHQTEPMPAGSKMPLGKAKFTSKSNSASGITHVRSGKKLLCGSNCHQAEQSGNMWEQQLCRHQGQGRRGRRCSRCQSWDTPEAPAEDHVEAGWHRAAHGGPWLSTCSPWRAPSWSRWMAEGDNLGRSEGEPRNLRFGFIPHYLALIW